MRHHSTGISVPHFVTVYNWFFFGRQLLRFMGCFVRDFDGVIFNHFWIPNSSSSLNGCLFNFEWNVLLCVIIQRGSQYHILWPSTINFSLVNNSWDSWDVSSVTSMVYYSITFESQIHVPLSMDVCWILSQMFEGASSFNGDLSTTFCEHLWLFLLGRIVEVHGMFRPWHQWSNI